MDHSRKSRIKGRWFAGTYLLFVGGYAGWHGHQMWTWQHVTVVAVIPAAFALLILLPIALRNPTLPLILLYLVGGTVLSGVTMGGMGLLVAWGITNVVGDWDDPIARLATSIGLVLPCVGLTFWATRRKDHFNENSRPVG